MNSSNYVISLQDYRSKFPSVRDQGSFPLCLAFAASDLNAYTHSLATEFSVAYLALRACFGSITSTLVTGLSFVDIVRALKLDGQPFETLYPICSLLSNQSISLNADTKFFKSNGVTNTLNIDEIKQALNKQVSIVIGVQLTNAFFNPSPPFIFDDDTSFAGLHALLVVGFREMSDGTLHFLVRNSWGIGWADKGYAWITSRFFSNRTTATLTLEKHDESGIR